MDYDDMTDGQIKKLLIDTMVERESLNYAFGWLRSSYCYPCDEGTERATAINKLKSYMEKI
jgi:hypothetical protein